MKYKIFLLGQNDENEGITCVENDLNAVAELFHDHSYIVKKSEKVEEYDIAKEIKLYISDLEKEDVFIFFYAGHAYLKSGDFYLFLNGEEVDFESMIYKTIKKQQKINNVLFIFDACISGKIGDYIDNNRDSFRGITATTHQENSIEMTKKDADNLNISYPLGFFTYFLLVSIENLFQKYKKIKVNELGKEIKKQIENHQKDIPIPKIHGNNDNNFYFIEKNDCKTILNTFFHEHYKSNFDVFFQELSIKIKNCFNEDCPNYKNFKQLINILKLKNLTSKSKKILLNSIKDEFKTCL